MAAHGGPFDVTLDFGYRVEQTDEPTFEVRVAMSWEHAISMVAVLQSQIEQYEAQIPSLATFRDKLVDATEQVAAEEKA